MGKVDIKVVKEFVKIEKYLLNARDINDLFKRITEKSVSFFDVDSSAIFDFNEKEKKLKGETGYGIGESTIKKIEIPLSFSKTVRKAYETKKPVFVIDKEKEDMIPEEFVKKYGFRSSIILPLVGTKGKVLDFLFLDVRGKVKKFSKDEKIFAESFANLAAISIEQKKVKRKLQKIITILSSYGDVKMSAFHPVDIEVILKKALKSSLQALDMDIGLLQIVEDGKLVIKNHQGICREYLKKHKTIKMGHHISGKVAKTQKPIIVENASGDSRTTKSVVKMLGYKSLISIPLLADDKTVGVITVASSQERRFEQEEIDYFTNRGEQLGVLIENAILFEEMGLSNKRIKALVELNQTLVSILELPLLYEKVLKELPTIVPCFLASILTIDDSGKKLIVEDCFAKKEKVCDGRKRDIRKGVTGKVALRGEPIIVHDFSKEKNYAGSIKGIKSEIVVPISVKDRVIGVLNIESKKKNAYTESDLEVLTAITNMLSIAIENAHLYQETRERAAQLELINKVIKEIGTTQDIDALSQKVCDTIQGHFYYDHTLLFLLDEEKENLVLKGYAGLPYEVKQFKQSVNKGLFGLAIRERKSIIENETERNKYFISKLPDEEAALSEMDIPLASGEKVLGLLSLQSRTQGAFSDWDLVAMETISEHIVSSLNNAELYTDLKRRMSEISTIYDIGVELSASRDFDELLEKIYERTGKMTGATTFYVALYDEKEKMVKFEIDYEEGIRREKETYKLSEVGGYTGWILRNNTPILIQDLKKDIDKYPVKPIFDGLKMESYLGIPVRFKDKVIGVLSLQSRKPNLFDKSTLNIFTIFANQLGVVIENARLFTEMDVVLKKLEKSYDETLRSLVSALDFREKETQYHSMRVALYAVELAKRYGTPERELKFIYWGGILHDIGKIGVSDEILMKPSGLTKKEWEEIKKHPTIGYEIVRGINFLREASDVVLYHHEWWNGSGYPYGKKGKNIPMWARIFSVADAFDSMTSRRPYKDAVTFDEALKEIKRCSGTQFDPDVVKAFLSVPKRILERIKETKSYKVRFGIPKLEETYRKVQ
jgi:putative nucleotidyltransferase with HDIG domain